MLGFLNGGPTLYYHIRGEHKRSSPSTQSFFGEIFHAKKQNKARNRILRGRFGSGRSEHALLWRLEGPIDGQRLCVGPGLHGRGDEVSSAVLSA